jgi:hypothetical protein
MFFFSGRQNHPCVNTVESCHLDWHYRVNSATICWPNGFNRCHVLHPTSLYIACIMPFGIISTGSQYVTIYHGYFSRLPGDSGSNFGNYWCCENCDATVVEKKEEVKKKITCSSKKNWTIQQPIYREEREKWEIVF